MEYFACARSNTAAPPSSTMTSRAPARKSSTVRANASGVMVRCLHLLRELLSVMCNHLAAAIPPCGIMRGPWESFPVQGHLTTVDKIRCFLQHYGLTEHDLERYLAAALSAGGEYADLYFEYLSSTSVMVDESMVKSASQGISAGCGVRVVVGERTGYAYTDDLSSERILHAARTAALIASGPSKTTVVGFQEKAARSLYPVTLPSVDAEITAKVELVMRADQSARAYDVRIQEVRASYADELRNILVVGS